MPIVTPQERIGTVLGGKYRLGSLIGKGGMGMVFRGEHELTGRAVAIKLLHPEHTQSEEVCARFLREARTAAGLQHPHVVDVLDMGREDGAVYIVLELLEGEPLSSLLHDEGALSVDRAAAILLPVMRAVAMAHTRHVVHRDLKPENIFIHHDATGAEVPKILDFGIAKALGEEQDGRVTQTGFVLGTPAYMSPEQAEGIPEKIGPPADVWSMGVVWYEALSGTLPFGGQTHTAILLSVVQGKFQRLTRRAPTVPVALAAAIDKALVKDPTRRYPDMGAFLQAIERALEAPHELPGPDTSVLDTPQPAAPGPAWTLDGPPAPAASTAPHEASKPVSLLGTVSLQSPIPLVRRAPAPSRPPNDSLVAPITLATPLPSRSHRSNSRIALGVAVGVAFAAGVGAVALGVFRAPLRPPQPTIAHPTQVATHAPAPMSPSLPEVSDLSLSPRPSSADAAPSDGTTGPTSTAPIAPSTLSPTSSPPSERGTRRHNRRDDPRDGPTPEELRANPLLILAPRSPTPPAAPAVPPSPAVPAPPVPSGPPMAPVAAPPASPPPTLPSPSPAPPRPSAPTHEPLRDYEASS